MVGDDQRRLVDGILQANEWFMGLLTAVRTCDPPDWYIGTGAIRTIVWDYLHGAHVDVGFFDPHDLRPARDAAMEAELHALRPDVPWEAKNQAAVHLWYERVFGYPVAPLTSCVDAIGTFPETVTSIGVRLLDNQCLELAAPNGLNDLLNMVLRRNPRRVTLEPFLQRLAEKRVQERWPLVRVVDG